MVRMTRRGLSMAGAAVVSVASIHCGGRVPVGVADTDGGSGSGNGSTGTFSSTGSFAGTGTSGTVSGVTGSDVSPPAYATGTTGTGTTGTTGTYSSGSSGYGVGYYDATAPNPGEDAAASPVIGDSTAPADVACWESQLPPEDEPIQPTAAPSMTCENYPGITQWNAPGPDGGVLYAGDGRAAIIGRWVTCSGGAGSGGSGSQTTDTSTFSSDPHAGIEFGGNGRWRLLVLDSSGAVVPTTATDIHAQGRYYALSTGELNLRDNGAAYLDTMFVKLSPDGNTLQITSESGSDGAAAYGAAYYARTTPAANNGDDNLPSTTDGTCSMVGTWELAMTSQSPAGTFSFDELGNFVGGVPGTDLCSSHTMYGTYRLSPGLFQFTENYDMGGCAWWFDAGFMTSFDATCTHLTLVQEYDNCTGARGYFNGTTTLTKAP